MATETKKLEVIKNHAKHEKDTGSTGVQIALLSSRINRLIEHLKENENDHHSKRGLLVLVGQRRRLLKYYRQKDYPAFQELVKKLDLKE